VTRSGEIARFRALLARRLGWTFADSDAGQLAHVLQRRSDTLRRSPGAYLAWLGAVDRPEELAVLAQELTITETYFFRHGEQLRALADDVLPERLEARAARRTLQMLSVGCSSGEEAYTLAIVAREAQPDPGWIVSVVGLDANPAMLENAATGRYSAWALRETPDALRQKWFRAHEDGLYEVEPDLRRDVQFRYCNVAADDELVWRPEQYDVIFCRNLLMYLTPATAGTLVRRMTRALAPGGFLFLGHTDTLGSKPEGLEAQHSKHAFYYRRPYSDPVAGLAPRPLRAEPPVRRKVPPAHPEPDAQDQALALLRNERFAEALAVLEASPPARPQPADLLLHGVLLAQAGRLEDAEILSRRLLDADGLYADAHQLLAVCLEDGAAVDVAIGHYRLAAYLDPAFAMPRLRLGLLLRRRGDHAGAGAELDRALHLLRGERDERIALFGGGFGRIALTALCRAELDACGVRR
jgi:chemotaxis protein methyltransferase CheR